MTKSALALAIASILALPPHIAPARAGEQAVSLVKRMDWRDSGFASYLPSPASQAPWLNLDVRTKLPKGDFPLGRNADSIGQLTFGPAPGTQLSSNVTANSWFQ